MPVPGLHRHRGAHIHMQAKHSEGRRGKNWRGGVHACWVLNFLESDSEKGLEMQGVYWRRRQDGVKEKVKLPFDPTQAQTAWQGTLE